MRFEANTSKFFPVFDCLVVLTGCSDAKMTRSDDFCADRRRQMTDKTDCFTPCACARGNKASYSAAVCEIHWSPFKLVRVHLQCFNISG